eukprot:1365643-Lingulodinium_polyedra.AAC.1
MAAALIFLARRDLGAPLARTVSVFDASHLGAGVMTKRCPAAAVASAAQWNERWRFARGGDRG